MRSKADETLVIVETLICPLCLYDLTIASQSNNNTRKVEVLHRGLMMYNTVLILLNSQFNVLIHAVRFWVIIQEVVDVFFPKLLSDGSADLAEQLDVKISITQKNNS